jgi:transcriptional regulator with XRE-family HTH domain
MIGKQLKELRKRKNITQKELAKVIGVTTGTISHYESRFKNPRYDNLVKISEYFNVTTDFLNGYETKDQEEHQKDIIEIFAEKLKRLRVQRGFSQKELSKKLDIKNSTFYRYESGRHMPSLEILGDICKKLNVTPNYFLGYESDTKQLSREEMEMIKILENMGLNILCLVDDLKYLLSKYEPLFKLKENLFLDS